MTYLEEVVNPLRPNHDHCSGTIKPRASGASQQTEWDGPRYTIAPSYQYSLLTSGWVLSVGLVDLLEGFRGTIAPHHVCAFGYTIRHPKLPRKQTQRSVTSFEMPRCATSCRQAAKKNCICLDHTYVMPIFFSCSLYRVSALQPSVLYIWEVRQGVSQTLV
jgi:hypothetical protein